LPLLGQQFQNFSDVANKAHVQHAIGFIQDKEVHVFEVQKALIVEIQQPSRGGHQNINASSKRPDLSVLFDSSEDHEMPQLEVATVEGEVVSNLGGKLACWSQDQRSDLPLSVVRVMREVLENREQKGCRLSRSRLSTPEHVLAGEQWRNGLGLDGRGRAVAFLSDRAANGLDQVEGIEGVQEVYLLAVCVESPPVYG
jgi:hypothetical protein